MRFDPSTCPACGQPAQGTLETIPGLARLIFDEQGDAQYLGQTDVCWDAQTPDRTDDGRAVLVCPGGHAWPAHMPP
jgi:hypothetical protein